jgi:hypothetical protein
MQYSPNEELLLFGILSLYLILKRIGIISSSSAFISGKKFKINQDSATTNLP